MFKKLFSLCAWQLLDTSYLSKFKKETEILICFLGIRECVFGTSFLLTLDIYKAYFRSRHIREYKENECKRWWCFILSERSYCVFCALGFCNQMLLDLHCWWSEELCSQHFLQVGVLVTYWDPCKGWRSYIEEFRGSEAVEGFCCKFIYGDCRV